ncbi:MAG: hypothetical protein ACXW0T_11785 [Methylobacter sp.]
MTIKKNIISYLLTLILFGTITPSYAGRGEPEARGKTYGEWSAAWWQWVRSIPAANNPLVASGPVDCSVGQTEEVTFLAGTTGSSPVERQCSVPKQKALFFSAFNIMVFNEIGESYSKVEKRGILNGILNDADGANDVFGGSRVCNVAVTVDGLPNLLIFATTTARTQSPPFRIEIGEDDVFGTTAGTIDDEAISDGVWVMLRLSPGQHTLHVQGALCDLNNQPIAGFQQDYTYILQVE